MINWDINKSSQQTIEESFTRITKDLFKAAIKVNEHYLRITEIEFYYWCPTHQDNTTHDHERLGGEWRMHNQGLDITLEASGDEETGHNGGILIRGIYDGNTPFIKSKGKPMQYVNGPRNVLFRIFERMGKVDISSTLQLVPNHFPVTDKIYKAKRHGLKPFDGGKDKRYPIDVTQLNYHYRYFTDKEQLYTEAYWKNADAKAL